MKTRHGQMSVAYTARGIRTYCLELWHDGLKKHRLIRGESESIVDLKATLQAEEWEQRWAVVDARAKERSQNSAGKALAAERTAEAQQEIERLSSILQATLSIDDTVDWESLKDKTPFPEERPLPPALPPAPALPQIRREPDFHDHIYTPSLSLLDKLISSRRERACRTTKAILSAPQGMGAGSRRD